MHLANRMQTAAFVVTFICVGCGQNEHPELRQVTGTIIYHDAPVVGAVVAFHNDQAKRLASGQTDEDGKFSLTSFDQNDGALPGAHTVVVSKFQEEEEAPALSMDDALSSRPRRVTKQRQLLPKKYNSKDTSPLVVEVSEDRSNHLEIVLED